MPGPDWSVSNETLLLPCDLEHPHLLFQVPSAGYILGKDECVYLETVTLLQRR